MPIFNHPVHREFFPVLGHYGLGALSLAETLLLASGWTYWLDRPGLLHSRSLEPFA